MNPLHFPRPALASAFADELMGRTPMSDAPNGLFIAGERRTGKTQFIRLDLKPALESRGLLVLYVDLKTNLKLSVVEAVQQVLHQAVQDNLSAVSKKLKELGLDKLGVPGILGLDLRSLGKTEGLSMYQVLNVLAKATTKKIVFIIDEAQHALTSDDGEALMWSLKSARDQMKTAESSDLMLVMSGSHTDKLTMLLNSPKAPFWGSQVRAMPKLDDDFVRSYTRQVAQSRPEFSTVRGSEMVRAFEHFGRRPQFFIGAVANAASQSQSAEQFEQMLVRESQAQSKVDRQRFSDMFNALSPLEQAVLERLITQGKEFKPFDSSAMAFYSERLSNAKSNGKPKVSIVQVQRAIDSLRNNDEELVWKSSRGDYAIYDQNLITWHAYLVAERAWPPKA